MASKDGEVHVDALRAILDLSDHSMADVARGTDTSYGTLGPIFAGHRGMSASMAERIAAFLKIPVEAIFTKHPAGAIECDRCHGKGYLAGSMRRAA